MATIEFKGIDEYAKRLSKLGSEGIGICKAAVYEGADEVADAVRQSIQSLRTIETVDAMNAWREKREVDALTEKQKKGLLDGLYLEKMKDEEGFIYTKIGFAGYNAEKTKQYPQGQPNSMIARATESGSSARRKHPFVRPAVNAVKAAAEARMAKKVDEMVNKTMNQ